MPGCRFPRDPFVTGSKGDRGTDDRGPSAGDGPMADARVIHFEIVGKDQGALQRYYGNLFGWKLNTDFPGGYGMTDPARDGADRRGRRHPRRVRRPRHRLRHGRRHRRDAGEGGRSRRVGDHAQVQPGRERPAGAGRGPRGPCPGPHPDVIAAPRRGAGRRAPARPAGALLHARRNPVPDGAERDCGGTIVLWRSGPHRRQFLLCGRVAFRTVESGPSHHARRTTRTDIVTRRGAPNA